MLILAGEIVFADHMAEVLEHRERLARRMQCLALSPGQEFRSPDRIHDLCLIVLGDRRKAHDLPIFLRQHVADQILLVQAVHDHHDGPRELVVKPAVESVVVPVVRGFPLRLGERVVRASTDHRLG